MKERYVVETILGANKSIVAILIRGEKSEKGIKFFTDPLLPLQVACMVHPAGHIIPAHRHKLSVRTIYGTPEVLIVKKGTLWAYIEGQKWLLSPEDVLILFSGVHSFEVVKDCEVWEVKIGPYLGKDDKVLSILWENGPTY